jgi:hypothetical protein
MAVRFGICSAIAVLPLGCCLGCDAGRSANNGAACCGAGVIATLFGAPKTVLSPYVRLSVEHSDFEPEGRRQPECISIVCQWIPVENATIDRNVCTWCSLIV